MKKGIFTLLAILVMTLSALMPGASIAEPDQAFIDSYNDYAYATGAGQLDIATMTTASNNPNMFIFQLGEYNVAFEMFSGKTVKNGYVFTGSNSCTVDFLCGCMAMVSFLGEIDIHSYGMLMSQFSALYAGHDSTPGTIGQDAFQIILDDNMGYLLVYMNNDLIVNN